MTYKISPSSMNLVEECPRCFWLQLVKREKRPETPFPSLPSGMDKMLKEHFDRFMEKNALPPELIYHGKHDYQLFDDKELLKKWRNNLKGIEYYDENADILLHGAIDNILVKDCSVGQLITQCP